MQMRFFKKQKKYMNLYFLGGLGIKKGKNYR